MTKGGKWELPRYVKVTAVHKVITLDSGSGTRCRDPFLLGS